MVVPYRICYLDIEAENLATDDPGEIYTISFYDSFEDEMVTLQQHNDERRRNEIVTYDTVRGKEERNIREYFPDEKSFLAFFIGEIRRRDFDVIAAWNLFGYDFPYLINRMIKLGLNPKSLSPTRYIDVDKGRIGGRILADMYVLYQDMTEGELRSYKLEFVMREYGIYMGKTPEKVGSWQENDRESLIVYNVKDVDALVYLDNEVSLIEQYYNISVISGVHFRYSMKSSKIIDSLCMRVSNRILPSKDYSKQRKVPYIGAKVIEPAVGERVENVGIFDFSRLYPNIMDRFNISYETIGGDGIVAPNGVSFSSKQGLIPKVISKLFVMRDDLEKTRDRFKVEDDEYSHFTNRITAVKGIINSVYGVFGHPNFRLYRPEIAATVTFVGRRLLNLVKHTVESLGRRVTGGDTDSVHVTVSSVDEGKKLENAINEVVSGQFEKWGCDATISVEFETFFSAILYGKKKRYAGLSTWRDGEYLKEPYFYVRGFEIRRSDSPQITIDLQERVFKDILKGKSEMEVSYFIAETINDIMNGRRDIMDIGFLKRIAKPIDEYKVIPIHLRASRYSNQLFGTNFGTGDKVHYIYINPPEGAKFMNVLGYDEYSAKYIPMEMVDMPTMIEKAIIKKISSVFEGLGWNYEMFERLVR